MQVPKPFSTVHGYFAEPIYPVAGEKLEAYRRRIEANLLELEAQFEPGEAIYNVTPLLGDAVQSDQDGQDDHCRDDDLELKNPGAENFSDLHAKAA